MGRLLPSAGWMIYIYCRVGHLVSGYGENTEAVITKERVLSLNLSARHLCNPMYFQFLH